MQDVAATRARWIAERRQITPKAAGISILVTAERDLAAGTRRCR